MSDDRESTDFDLDEFLPYVLNQVAEALSKRFQQHYQRDFGLSRTQWRILAHLARQDGLTAKDIGARIHEDKVSISRAVAALESQRRLTRKPGRNDRRFDELYLTPDGNNVFRQVTERAHAFEADLSQQLGQQTTNDLRRILSGLLPLLRNSPRQE